MKDFVFLIIPLCGFAFVFTSIISVVNMLTGWELGYKGNEVPADPAFAISFLVLGLIVAPVGLVPGRKFGNCFNFDFKKRLT